ncbi:MAG: 1-deoxy-D-xylulose-5-phosphate synthase [Planctomycetota bacterium]
MYIEDKSTSLNGPARIGRVTFSKTGKTLHYGRRKFQSLGGQGFKSNYFDLETSEEFWISGCRKDGADRLYGGGVPVEIDEDVREEYWTSIRGLPERKGDART